MSFILYTISSLHRVFVESTQLSLQGGISPVYAASKNDHTEVVDLLVQAGADIHLAATKVHVSTHTVSSSVAAVVETNEPFCQTRDH